ncbi:MAG TPA: hypothetical protein PKA27_05045 [Fimbriimonadaceae bacterium]|nr:hypothetical protein [Fimbriimonadaceae bacterium]
MLPPWYPYDSMSVGPDVAKGVWTLKRRIMGNLIPALLALPFLAGGLAWMMMRKEILGVGLILVGLFPLVGWLAANSFGLYQNSKMRHEMLRRLITAKGSVCPRRYFVGIATPGYRGLIDPHEDVGYLLLEPSFIEFFGEHLNSRVNKEDVTGVRFRANAHSWLGLGRWVSIEGMVDGKPIRLLCEPREKRTLLGNRRFSSELKNRIELWLKDKIAPEETSEADPDVLSS